MYRLLFIYLKFCDNRTTSVQNNKIFPYEIVRVISAFEMVYRLI